MSSRPFSRVLGALAVLVAMAGAAAACAPAPAAPAKPASASPTTAPAKPAAAAPAAPPATTESVLMLDPAAPQTFRWAGQSPASDAGLYVAMERGYFAQVGVQLEYAHFSSASEMVPALATQQVEGGGLAVNPATINAVARGVEIKAVADKGSMRPGFGSQALLVRRDLVDSGRVRTLGDLKGLVFATTPPINAGAGYPALERVLRQAGLSQDDIRMEAMGFPEVNAALAGRAIDFAIQTEPLVHAAVEQGLAVRWIGQDEIYPNQQIAVVGFGPSITVQNQALGRAFIWGYLRGVRDYYWAATRGEGKAEIAAIIAKYSTVKDPAVVEAMTPVGLHPDGVINVNGLIADQQFYVEKGTVPTPVDMHQLVDHSYVNAVLTGRMLLPGR
jgi:NitT/TauT family transport system substrate-binding protein